MKALVIGLAVTGVAVTRRLRAEGFDVVVTEDMPRDDDTARARRAEVLATGAAVVDAPDDRESARLASEADLVVPSPLVRPTHPSVVAARAAGVPVRAEIDIAAERATMPIVAVTGTNGKTTVTSMIAEILDASGRRATAAGNIGRPLIDAIDDSVDVVVAEVSSFQLEFAPTFRPRVAVLLAITPDHLDWHGGFASYAASKARVTEQQAPGDLFVFDADDDSARAVAARSPARSVGVSLRADASGCYRVVGDTLVRPDGAEIIALREMRRALMHDRTNALAAAAAAFEVGATDTGTRVALARYATMRHRVALVGEASGVQWYDDSKATNPDAALRAVASFDSVVLLAGGRNKGLDLSVLASEAARLRGVVAFGESGPEVAQAFASTTVPVVTVPAMHEAVLAARELASDGDVVLLSPACASFDAYSGYAERGDDFAREVDALIEREASRA